MRTDEDVVILHPAAGDTPAVHILLFVAALFAAIYVLGMLAVALVYCLFLIPALALGTRLPAALPDESG